MKLLPFIKDKLIFLLISIFSYFLIVLMLSAFKIQKNLIIAISIILLLSFTLKFFVEFFRKKFFYDNLLVNIKELAQSYLVLETLEKPSFYEGELLYQALYDINKSMCECVQNYELQVNDFKEYIEMWIHEVKIPISSLILMAHNHKDKFDKRSVEQMKRIENYVEQVLYYVRQESAEKDYLINEVSLNKVIASVALKNKDDFLEHKIDLKVKNVNYKIFTDSKWLEFILNQIINNSIKYKRNIMDSYIKISAKEEKERTTLIIEDNGIGISSTDIPKVFDKSFTGHNGRMKTKSTGMGLFIAKNLCEKLGHQIKIESQENNYTKVYILFSKNQYYDVVK